MVQPLFQTTLLGHAVDSWLPPKTPADEQANEWRLSRMQRRLLSETPWVRVVDAPTGSGKSYAFQKAVLPERGGPGARGGHVLFVAPTRRLTENLAASLKEGLVVETAHRAEELGLNKDQHRLAVEKAVMVWNGQQVIDGARHGRTAWRKRQFGSMENCLGLGRTVFTVLEIVRDMLFPTRLVAGEGDNRGSVWLSRFKHVVFDEFHTLGPDGLALALVVVAMAQAMNRREHARFLERQAKGGEDTRGPSYTYLTFLSATPVDVLKFLEAGLGPDSSAVVPGEMGDEDPSRSSRLVRLRETDHGDGVCLVSEPLIHSDGEEWPATSLWATQNRYRALHGDVVLEGFEAESLGDLVEHCIDDVVADLQECRQVVCLWDSKAQLIIEKDDLEKLVRAAWRAAGETRQLEFLEVHAAADRRRGEDVRSGRLEAADVILGTASVEAGITFRGNRLLIMEPGFTLLNMVQRLGRCARGISNGQPTRGRVVVRLDPDGAWKNGYRAWLPAAINAMMSLPPFVRIDSFLSELRRAVWPADSGGLYQQEGLDQRAQARASLFWAGCWLAFERNGRHRSEEWMGHPPARVRYAKAQLGKLEGLMRRPKMTRRNGGPVSTQMLLSGEYMALKEWLAIWRQESQALRDIAPTVWVLDTDRLSRSWRAQPFDLAWLARFTTVLESGEACSVDEARQLLPCEDWNDGDIFIRLPVGQEMEVLPKDRRKNRRTSPPGQDFLLPLGGTRWLDGSGLAARHSSEQLDRLADDAESRLRFLVALSPSQRKEGEGLVFALRGLARLVASTGRAVPAKINIDAATSEWLDSLVI